MIRALGLAGNLRPRLRTRLLRDVAWRDASGSDDELLWFSFGKGSAVVSAAPNTQRQLEEIEDMHGYGGDRRRLPPKSLETFGWERVGLVGGPVDSPWVVRLGRLIVDNGWVTDESAPEVVWGGGGRLYAVDQTLGYEEQRVLVREELASP